MCQRQYFRYIRKTKKKMVYFQNIFKKKSFLKTHTNHCTCHKHFHKVPPPITRRINRVTLYIYTYLYLYICVCVIYLYTYLHTLYPHHYTAKVNVLCRCECIIYHPSRMLIEMYMDSVRRAYSNRKA